MIKEDLEKIGMTTPYDALDAFLIGNNDLRSYLVDICGEMEDDCYYNLGMSYNRYNFRLNQALKAFETALSINPEHKSARLYMDALNKGLDP